MIFNAATIPASKAITITSTLNVMTRLDAEAPGLKLHE